MTKSEYISNSAKLLMICSVFLFVANALVFFGSAGGTVALLGERLSNFTFYFVTIAVFLAFNGEGIAYKRSKEKSKKRFTNILKFLLVFSFLIRYVKKPFEDFILSSIGENGTSIGSLIAKVFLGTFNTVASFSFLFMMVSFWYMMRDNANNKLLVLQSGTFLVGIVYNFYRIFNYAITKYGLTPGDFYTWLFSNETFMKTAVLLFYALSGVMFFAVMKAYNKYVLDEQEAVRKTKKNMNFARKIYNTDCVGIDTLEDDWLLHDE